MNWSSSVVLPGGTVNLIYLIHYLIVCLLLLLSGDVELNPGPITGKHALNTTLINWCTTVGNPKGILRRSFAVLVRAILNTLSSVATELYSEELIPQKAFDEVSLIGITDFDKAIKLLRVIEGQLEASCTPDQYLTVVCHVLINQQQQSLTNIANNILQQLGECVCVYVIIILGDHE